MRLLHSIRSVNPASGGTLEALFQLAHVHQEQGHSGEIVSLDNVDDPWVKECRFPVHALGEATSTYGYSSQLVPWLTEREQDFDAVVVHGLWQFHSFGVWRALGKSKLPYFVYPHGMLDPWFKQAFPLKHLKKWLYWPWAEYRVLRDAAAVLFTCEEERRLARESFWLYRCNEKVVGLGIAEPSGNASFQEEAFLERFPTLREKPFLLFLGRVHPKKGVDLLLKAYAAVAKGGNGDRRGMPTLVIAGPCDDHSYRASLKSIAADLNLPQVDCAKNGERERDTWCDGVPGIVWLPMLQGDHKWGALRACSAFVLPSHQENFGIAVVEALACGKPVLISNKVNIWREIEAVGAGFVEPDTLQGTETLLRKWLQLFGDTEHGAAVPMEARAHRCFEQRFDTKQAAEALLLTVQEYSESSSQPKVRIQ